MTATNQDPRTADAPSIPAVASPASRFTVLSLILLAGYAASQLPMLTQAPNVLIDEPWYASISHCWLTHGVLRDLIGQDSWISLYPVLMAGPFAMAGTDLLVARLVSVLAGALALLGFLGIVRYLRLPGAATLLCGAVFVLSNVVYAIARTVRPEMWVLAFLAWAVLLLLKAIDTSEPRYFFGAALLASLAFWCHPAPAIFIFLLGLYALARSVRLRKAGPVLGVIAGFLIVFGLMVLFILFVKKANPIEIFGLWTSRTAGGETGPASAGVLRDNLTSFFSTYTMGWRRAYIVLFEFGLLAVGLLYIRRDRRIFAVSMLALSYFVLGSVFLKPFTSRMYSPVLLLCLVLYALLLHRYWFNGALARKLLLAAGALYLLNNAAGDAFLLYRDRHNTPYGAIEQRINAAVPDGKLVAAECWYWFALRNNEAYYEYHRWRDTPYDSVESLIASGKIEYVVLSGFGVEITNISTTGRVDEGSKGHKKRRHFHEAVKAFAEKNGKLVDSFEAKPYGVIRIWKTQPDLSPGAPK
jgi:4-amino-4-deoxy-L-arabinose transferase-like glycosyltransferase